MEPPVIINDVTKEAGYVAQRGGLLVIGKHSAEALGETLGRAVSPGAANHVAGMGGAISGVGGLLTIGLAAAVSAALTQMDYYHRKDNLKELYKEELSAKLGKPVKTLQRNDLDTLAENNGVIDEELRRSGKQRTFGVALSFVASMAALAVVMLALPAAVAAVPALAAAETALLTGFLGFVVKGAVGLATYHAVKEPLHWVADKLFDIDKPTANDRIVAMKRDREAGKAISVEQVLAVFAAANPNLDTYIVQEYGRHYDQLGLEDKKQLAQGLSKYVPLEKLTQEINSGQVNVTELAFAVEGQASGVDHLIRPAEMEKKGILTVMWEKMTGKGTRVAAQAESYVTPLTGMVAQAVVMYDNETPGKTFVQKLGLSRKEGLGHVERVEQARNDPTTGIHQP